MLEPYQITARNFLVDRLSTHKGAGLFLDPGLGKTYVTLSVFDIMRRLEGWSKMLIVAPLRVASTTWPDEIEKWDFDFSYSIIHGTVTQRRNACWKDSDIYVINPEGIKWFAKWVLDTKLDLGIDVIVFDESTKFKNWMAVRNQWVRKLLPQIPKRIILTGTPTPHTYADLHPQCHLLDDGETLGKTKGVFCAKYMVKGGFKGRQWVFRKEKEEELWEAIGSMVLRMSAEEYLDLPPIVYHDVWITLENKARKAYNKLERELFLALDSGEDLTASNAGAKYNMCKQFANGGVYDKERNVHATSNAKLEALVDLAEELNGKPLLLAYQFKHDKDRIVAHKLFKNAGVIGGHTKAKDADILIKKWNGGLLRFLMVQPRSLSHGVNLQEGGKDLAWFGLTDSLEDYLQLNKRLHRKGTTGQVRIHHLLAKDTIEEAVLQRTKEKDVRQQKLLQALENYRARHR